MIRRIIIVNMVISLFMVQTIHAVQLRDLANISSSKASSWTSGATGKHYYYSGSYQFTFSGKNNYQPWINGSAPGFQSGCGGISIKGMFLSLLGFNEIKDQLSAAGGKLAWGIVLSLAASVPIIEKVFAHIQKWAGLLRRLLQNACQIGQNIGKKMWGESPISNWIMSKISTSGAESVYNSMMKGIDEAYKQTEGYVDSLIGSSSGEKCKDLTGVARTKCETKANSPIADKVNSIAKKGYADFTSTIIGTKKVKDNPTNYIYISRLKTLLNNRKIGGYELIATRDADNIKITLLLARVMFGDFAISKNTIKSLTALTDCDSLPSDGKCTILADRLKSEIKSKQSGYNKFGIDVSYSYIQPILTAKDSASALIYGFKKAHNNTLCDDGWCKIKNNQVVFVDLGIKNTDKGSEAKRLLANISPDTALDGDLKVEWSGALNESLKQIKHIVKSNGGDENPTLGYLKGKSIKAQDVGFPVLIPGIKKYIKLIVAIERDNGSSGKAKESMFTASLKELLAKYNAYLFSVSFIKFIEAKAKEGISKDSLAPADLKNIKALIDNIENTSKEIKKELDKTMDIVKLNKTISEIFTQVDKERRMSISNTLR